MSAEHEKKLADEAAAQLPEHGMRVAWASGLAPPCTTCCQRRQHVGGTSGHA